MFMAIYAIIFMLIRTRELGLIIYILYLYIILPLRQFDFRIGQLASDIFHA